MASILHLIPTLEGGGAERQLTSLAIEQSRSGFDVHIGLRRGGVHAALVARSDVKLHYIADRPSFDPRLLLGVRRLIRQVRPSIVQTWLFSMDLVGGVAASLNKTPWIISERTSGDYYDGLGRVASMRAYLARRAAAIVSNSCAGLEYWKNVLPEEHFAKLCVVRNALDFEAIRAAPPRARPHGPLLLVVGRLSPEKGIDSIVRSLAQVNSSELKVLIIGRGPLLEELQGLIATLGLQKRVVIQDYESDWWGWLKAADVLVSASHYEGNPNVVLEAMAAGCPVILSDIRSHREIASHSSALFFPVGDTERLSRAIDEALSRPDLARQRAEESLREISHHTFQAAATQYGQIYSSLMRGQRQVGPVSE
jgi:glycosyltransferase involved in cell wall biosynthesis